MSKTPSKHNAYRLRAQGCFAVILLAGLLSGCVKIELSDSLPWLESDPEPQVPKRVVAVWSDAVLHHAGKPSVRGFGGRLLFYGDDEEQPVEVDGQMTVYAFDDENPDPGNPTPEKKFFFPAENLPEHQSESSLGPSYSFWLPWNEIGGFQRQLSLVARFQDASGKVVMSKMAHVTLPGRLPAANGAATEVGKDEPSRGSGVRQASFDAPSDSEENEKVPAKPRMQTTTIHVTPSFTHQITKARKKPVLEKDANDQQEKPSERVAVVQQQTLTVEAPEAEATSADQQELGLRLPVGFRSVRERHQARTQPGSPPTYDPVRKQPHHAEWPRRLPPTPRSGWTRPTTTLNQPDESTGH